MRAKQGRRKTEGKPDYLHILSRTNKQFVTVVRRIIEHEGFYIVTAHHIESAKHFDVVLVGGRSVWIIRHPKNTTTAHFQEFPIHFFERLCGDREAPDLPKFLQTYHEKVTKLDASIWLAEAN